MEQQDQEKREGLDGDVEFESPPNEDDQIVEVVNLEGQNDEKVEDSQPKAAPRISGEKVASIVAFYFIVSISVVFLNKFIFVSTAYKFPLPLISTWIQLVVALVGLIIMGHMNRDGSLPFDIPPFQFDKNVALKVLPLTLAYVGMLAFNNMCLHHVQVSFYQVARSQTLTFNIVMTYYILNKKTSRNVLICCAFIIVGYLFGVQSNIVVTLVGVVYGIFSSFFVSLYGIMVERVMPHVKKNQWILLQYNTLLAIGVMLPFALIVEGGDLRYVENVGSLAFISVMFLTSVMGLLINLAMFLQIKYTSALTGVVSGTAKAAVQSIVGYFLFSEVLTSAESISIFVIIVASGAYSVVRYNESQAKKSQELKN